MNTVIAVAGKGGTGKTTIASLIVKILSAKADSVLGIDADPNSNLAESLGLPVQETIGEMLDELAAHPDTVPKGMTKDRFIDYKVQTLVQESNGFDILSMGRPEGSGCYCYVNNVLRGAMGKLIKDYQYTVVDNEAGLEHFSRRTTRAADILFVVSDASAMGLKAARRIHDLVKELKIKIKHSYLVINRFNGKIDSGRTQETGLEYIGSIPEDPYIVDLSLKGESILKLGEKSVSLSSLRTILEKTKAI
jgi:CO dehydrogenase maturation factor